VSVVPVGLTEFSKHHLVREPDEAECRAAVVEVERVAARAVAERGEPWAQGADELYIRAGMELPPASAYGSFDQVENGVGLVRQLLDDWRRLKRRLPATLPRPRHLTMACATLIAPVLQNIVDEMNTIGNLRVDVHVVRNRLFGDEVTVSGLIVGRDLLATLTGHELGDTLVLPRVMFDHGGTLTLDDMTLDELQDAVDRPIATVRRVTELGEVLAA